MPYGNFLSGLLSGAGQGIKLGQQINDIRDEYAVRQLRDQGIKEAQAQANASADGMVTDNTAAAAAATPAVAAEPTDAVPVTTGAVPDPSVGSTVTALPAADPNAPAATTAAAPSAAASGTLLPAATTTAVSAPDIAGTPAVTATPTSTDPAAAPTDGAVVAPSTAAATANGMPFSVGSKTFATRDEAKAYALKNSPSAIDLFAKNAVSKIQDAYITQGNPAQAEAWGKWADQKENQQAIKQWGKAWTSAQSGDMDQAATDFGKYYTDHVNDGVDYVGHRTILDANGKTAGFAINLKNKDTGKVSEMQLTPEAMLRMGSANNPQVLFAAEQARQAAADTAKAKATIAATKTAGQVVVAGVKATNSLAQSREKDAAAMARLVAGKQLDASAKSDEVMNDLATKTGILRDKGFSEDEIKTYIPALLKIGTKKTTDPTERANIVATELAKDPSFARMSAAKKSAAVSDVLSAAADGLRQSTGAGKPAPAPTPAAGGIPPAPGATPAGKTPYWDNSTGQVIYR